MVIGMDLMHGEAVNVGRFFCIVLGRLWGCVGADTVRIFLEFMTILILPRRINLLSVSKNWAGSRRRRSRRSRRRRGGRGDF